MNVFLNFLNRNLPALAISSTYVGLGTLAVLSIYPKDILYGDWSLWVLIVTFPVSAISFGYRFAEANTFYPVFIIQFVMLVLTFLAIIPFTSKKKKVI